MKVYLVIQQVHYEGSDVMHVCSTKEKAEEKIQEYIRGSKEKWKEDSDGDWTTGYTSLEIEEFDIDGEDDDYDREDI